jgi:hypothetical protein
MKSNNSIYHLERNGTPFYVGKTDRTKKRLKEHKKRFGDDIEMVIIDEVEDWKTAESEWINHYKQLGHSLINTHSGGNGRPSYESTGYGVLKKVIKEINREINWVKFTHDITPNFIKQTNEHYKQNGYKSTYDGLWQMFMTQYTKNIQYGG